MSDIRAGAREANPGEEVDLRACSAARDKLSTIALYGNNGIVSVGSVVDDKKLLGAGTQTNDYSFGRDKTLSLPQCAVTS